MLPPYNIFNKKARGKVVMDFFTVNKSTLNYRRVKRLDEKVVVFVLPNVTLGASEVEIRFPFKGRIVDVYASCSGKGTTKTTLDVEKCSQVEYDKVGTAPTWKSIFTEMLTIDSHLKSSKNSATTYVLDTTTSAVDVSDHFRVNIKGVGNGIKGLTVEVVIELSIEEQ